jgi:O-antigen/teichoic acid export membrane protein
MPSARRRFVFTVGMNLLRSAVSFTTAMLVARWLGPSRYGSLAFLIGTFAGLRALLDMGSSSAFFTFMSQRGRSRRFVNGYLQWLAIQFTIPLLVIAFLLPSHWVATIWRGEPRLLVILAFGAAFMQSSVWPVIQQAGESQRRTYLVQSIGVAVVLLHVVAVAAFWYFGLLGLYAVLAAIAVEYLLASIVVLGGLTFAPSDVDDRAPLLPKYVRYCLPLIPYAAVSFANEFADRWLLQRFGGGVQQAFYAVGAQLASIALIATSSILSIFWKEIAEAHHRGDPVRMGQLYHRVSRLLFFVGAVAAGLLIPWSEDILALILGPAYTAGAATLAIMLLYPVHQSMGQIGATMLYATERVALQVAVGTGTMLFGMSMTYLVLAPPSASVPGLGLASTGLAIKMVVVQIVSVNVLAYVIARVSGWRFDWIHQPASLVGCVVLGWVAHAAVVHIGTPPAPAPVRMLLGAALYLALVVGFVLALPSLTGFSRSELFADARRLAARIGKVAHA